METAPNRNAARHWPYILVFIGGLLLAAAFYLDAEMQEWVRQHATPGAKAFMRAVSSWGDWPSHLVAGALAAGLAYARRNRRWMMIFIAMILACALAGTVNRAIKIGTGRSRPAVELDAGWRMLRFTSDYNAFPSGHAAASTGFFAALCFASRLGLLFLPIPLLIAASRVYINAHHLSDVVAGAMVGTLCAWLVWRVVAGRLPTSGKRVRNSPKR